MPVNPTLEAILETMQNQGATAHGDAVIVQAKLDEIVAISNDNLLQNSLTAQYTGDIRQYMQGIQEKLDSLIGLSTEQRDTQASILALLDVMNNNGSLNWQNLMSFLDVMNANAAANALFIQKAVCGDCTVPQPPIDQGFTCRTSVGGYTGTDNPWESSFTWFISPTLTGQIGDKVRLRVNSVTEPMDLIYMKESPAGSAVTHPLVPGGDYIEFTLSAVTSVLGFIRSNENPFNFNFTACVQHLE